MGWLFERKQGNDAAGDPTVQAVNQLVSAAISEKRAILEGKQQLLMASNAMYWLWHLIHKLDEAGKDERRTLSEISPQEREFRMLNFGEGVRHQASAQYYLLHLTLLRDARDQGTPTAFSYFERGHAEWASSGLLSVGDTAALQTALRSGFLNIDEVATIRALVDLQNALLAHRTWEATRSVLQDRCSLLLTGLAEFLIEKDSDNIREGTITPRNPEFELKKNDAYRNLLRSARQIGIPKAWQQFQQRVREIEQS